MRERESIGVPEREREREREGGDRANELKREGERERIGVPEREREREREILSSINIMNTFEFL